MKKIFLAIFIFGFVLNFYSQKMSTFTDKRDGKVYKTITIGAQTWLAENLNVDKFRNGDLIPEAKTDDEWAKAGEEGTPAWCYYNNDPEMGKKYGKLYNWFAVNDNRGLAPAGWHIPSIEEITIFVNEVKKDGNALKTKDQGKENGAGTNSSGFSALLAGGRGDYATDKFNSLGNFAFFWFSTETIKSINGLARSISLLANSNDIYLYFSKKRQGLSIRCVFDY